VNRGPDQPISEEAAKSAGEDAEAGEDAGLGDAKRDLNLPLDALLDWGTDPLKTDENLEAELEAQSAEAILAAERDEYLDSLRRLQADFDNFRKRSIRQQTELLEHATEGLCMRLFPVLDALDLATTHLGAQAETNDAGRALGQIDSLLRDILAREGIEKIDAVGGPFDPTIHDAVGHVPAEPAGGPGPGTKTAPGDSPEAATLTPKPAAKPKGLKAPAPVTGPTVAQVMRPGYKMKSKVLRPAMVLVGG
jgi:molecular chaperone GrpE